MGNNRLERAEGAGGNPDLISQIKSRRVITRVIPKDWLPLYSAAASKTGCCEVTKIAGEGEEFPQLSKKFLKSGAEISRCNRDGSPKVIWSEVEKGYIAVSIERSGDSASLDVFWNLLSIRYWRERTLRSLNSTPRS